MNVEALRHALCKAFEVFEDQGVLLVRTPFGLDLNDDLILRVRPDQGGWRIDENGETLFALSMAGADPDAERVRELIEPAEMDPEDGTLYSRAISPDQIASAVFRLAGAALRVHATFRPRLRAEPSDIKERVVALLSDLAQQMGVGMQTDSVLDEGGNLTADAVLEGAEPFMVIVATTTERLMEAELLYLQRKVRQRPGYVCAVVPSAKTVGQKHFTRANYYTDKAVEFEGWADAFRELVHQQVQTPGALH